MWREIAILAVNMFIPLTAVKKQVTRSLSKALKVTLWTTHA